MATPGCILFLVTYPVISQAQMKNAIIAQSVELVWERRGLVCLRALLRDVAFLSLEGIPMHITCDVAGTIFDLEPGRKRVPFWTRLR